MTGSEFRMQAIINYLVKHGMEAMLSDTIDFLRAIDDKSPYFIQLIANLEMTLEQYQARNQTPNL